jgi:hypothetical protein
MPVVHKYSITYLAFPIGELMGASDKAFFDSEQTQAFALSGVKKIVAREVVADDLS